MSPHQQRQSDRAIVAREMRLDGAHGAHWLRQTGAGAAISDWPEQLLAAATAIGAGEAIDSGSQTRTVLARWRDLHVIASQRASADSLAVVWHDHLAECARRLLR